MKQMLMFVRRIGFALMQRDRPPKQITLQAKRLTLRAPLSGVSIHP